GKSSSVQDTTVPYAAKTAGAAVMARAAYGCRDDTVDGGEGDTDRRSERLQAVPDVRLQQEPALRLTSAHGCQDRSATGSVRLSSMYETVAKNGGYAAASNSAAHSLKAWEGYDDLAALALDHAWPTPSHPPPSLALSSATNVAAEDDFSPGVSPDMLLLRPRTGVPSASPLPEISPGLENLGESEPRYGSRGRGGRHGSEGDVGGVRFYPAPHDGGSGVCSGAGDELGMSPRLRSDASGAAARGHAVQALAVTPDFPATALMDRASWREVLDCQVSPVPWHVEDNARKQSGAWAAAAAACSDGRCGGASPEDDTWQLGLTGFDRLGGAQEKWAGLPQARRFWEEEDREEADGSGLLAELRRHGEQHTRGGGLRRQGALGLPLSPTFSLGDDPWDKSFVGCVESPLPSPLPTASGLANSTAAAEVDGGREKPLPAARGAPNPSSLPTAAGLDSLLNNLRDTPDMAVAPAMHAVPFRRTARADAAACPPVCRTSAPAASAATAAMQPAAAAARPAEAHEAIVATNKQLPADLEAPAATPGPESRKPQQNGPNAAQQRSPVLVGVALP
ncbi:hypothetical protein Agub_g12592, partial [Astrephomene gubernaculifera]